MQLLLVFLLGLFTVAVFSDPRAVLRPTRAQLLALCCLVTIGFMARRFI